MITSSKIELTRRHDKELAELRARHRAELAALRAAQRTAKAQEKKAQKKKNSGERWKNNDFFRAISEAYQTENRRKIYNLAQMYRRRHGITTAEEVLAFKTKLETEKAVRAEANKKHRDKLNQKKEFFEAIARAYQTEDRRKIHNLAQMFRRRHGITTAAEFLAYKAKQETEKAARTAEKEKKAAALAQKKEQSQRKETEKIEQRQKITEKKEALKKEGYICLSSVFELFNKCRSDAGRKTISKRGTLYGYLKRFRVRWAAVGKKEKFYFKPDIIAMATAPDQRGRYGDGVKFKSFFPTATPVDLESGEYCTRGEFARMTGLTISLVTYYSKNADFKMLQHPASGTALLHIPTAAAFFLNYYQKQTTCCTQ